MNNIQSILFPIDKFSLKLDQKIKIYAFLKF